MVGWVCCYNWTKINQVKKKKPQNCLSLIASKCYKNDKVSLQLSNVIETKCQSKTKNIFYCFRVS